MIIDFHIHMFPDKIVKGAIDALSKRAGIPAHTDGSVSDTLSKMQKAGVDLAVAQNIATNTRQMRNVNDFAIELNKNERIISFGSIHPDAPDYKSELDRLADDGIKGIKLHPDYQNFFIDERRMQPIYEYILKKGFILLFHAGLDVGLPEPIHATPEKISNVLSLFNGEKVCLAHMGGFMMHEKLLELVIGKDIYIDTSCVAEWVGLETFSMLLSAHRRDRVLFATDTPWNSFEQAVKIINSLDIDEQYKEMIFSENAKILLGI